MSGLCWVPDEGAGLGGWIRGSDVLSVHAVGWQWRIGDWVNFGRSRHLVTYGGASALCGLPVKTLRNAAYVASRFAAPRRRATVSWSHHAVLASWGEAFQDVWLDRIEETGISVSTLREAVRREAALHGRS